MDLKKTDVTTTINSSQLKDDGTQTSSTTTTTTTKRKFEQQVDVSVTSGEAKKKKIEESTSSSDRTTRILNPIDYESWTKEEVLAVLCTTTQKGGANLFEHDVKPLYDAGFKGTSIANIVRDIKKKDEEYALVQLGRLYVKKENSQLSDTCKTVVTWIDTLLKTKLYHLWSNDYAKEWLCKSIDTGGADLTIEQFNTVKISKVLRTIHSSDEKCMEKIFKWLETIPINVSLEIERLREQHISTSLSELLNGMTKLEMQQPQPYTFLNYNMQYVQRKEALDSYLDYTTKYLKNSDPKAGGASVIFIGTSPGVGKSRFAFELPSYLQSHFQNEIPNIKMINLAIWFSNDSNFHSSELDSLKKPLNLERSIIARMIYSYIMHINPHSWYGKYPSSEKSTNLDLLLTIFKDLDKVNIDMNNWLLEFLKWIVSNEQENGKNLWIHFTIDEYNQLIQSIKDEDSAILDELFEKLSSVRYALDGCIFTNLLAGTHIQTCVTLKNQPWGGKVYLKRIELLNFNKEEQEEIYNNEQFPLSVSKKTLFYSLGGHARLIELFRDKKDCETSTILKYLEDKMGEATGSIRIGEELEQSTLEILIALCISQYPIRDDKCINGTTLKQLQRSMILFLKHSDMAPEKIVYIPLLVLLRLIEKLVRCDPNHFMNSLKCNITNIITLGSKSDKFEDFNQLFLVTKLNCLKLLDTKKIIPSIRLDNIFPCADRSGVSIPLENSLFQKEQLRHHYPTTYIEKQSLDALLPNVVYKNRRGESFAEIFVILQSSSTKENIFCYIQVRHAELVISNNSSQNTKFLNNAEVKELNNVTRMIKKFWAKDVKIFNSVITSRPIGTDIGRSCCIGRNSNLEEYFGPFSIVVSYLGIVKLKLSEINEEDFCWMMGSNNFTSKFTTSIKEEWDKEEPLGRVQLLRNNFSLEQLQLLLEFIHEDDEQVLVNAIETFR